MTLLIAALVLAIICATWVIYPLLVNRWVQFHDAVPAGRLEREARRRTALAALKDAEYDHAAGKLDDSDYTALRSQLEVEALDAIRAEGGGGSAAPPSRDALHHVCGFQNPPGSRFCAGCGQRLS